MNADDSRIFLMNTDIQKEIDSLKKSLDKKGMKWTKQREELAVWVFNNHSHFTADDIISSFKNNNRQMPPATVYRFIQSLLELDLLIEHNIGESSKYYEHLPGHPHHDHLICTRCGRIEEFSDPRIETLQEEIAKKKGFILKKHTMILYGICPDCSGH
jgi:Fur family ferric uptake transcriptional regulator